MSDFKKNILNLPIIGSLILFLFRLKIISGFLWRQLRATLSWLIKSRETTNLTYDLTHLNDQYLACFLSQIMGRDYESIVQYFYELENDEILKKHIEHQILNSPGSLKADKTARYGRRKAWYTLIRLLKPKIVVETGVDKGLGSCVIASALVKNNSEGFAGYYYGIDINPKAGYLLADDYKNYGEIIYGDSIETLKKFEKEIDIFINDSDHSVDYEANEYQVVKNILSKKAIILGDNSHCSDKLFRFSLENNRNFLFFQEQPLFHWYPGAGIGVSYKQDNF